MAKKPSKSLSAIAEKPAKPVHAQPEKSPKKAKSTPQEAPQAVEPKKWKYITGPDAKAATPPSSFCKHDLQELELAQLRVNEARQKAELQKLAIERFVREVQEKIKASQEDLKRMNEDAESRAQSLMALYAEIEEAYALKIRDITYDTKSGRIMRAPPGLLDRA